MAADLFGGLGARLSERLKGALIRGDGLVEPPHLPQGVAQVVPRPSFAVAVTGLAVEVAVVEPPTVGDAFCGGRPCYGPQRRQAV